MTDKPDDTEEQKRLEAQALAGPPWGVIREDGTFREIPKRPLLNAARYSPPFEVMKPDGQVITIVVKPEDKS